MRTWPYESSSSDQTYITTLHDDGKMTCQCKGHTNLRKGKPRECRHITDVVKKHKFNVEVRGDYVYVTGEPSQLPILSSEGAKVQIGNGHVGEAPTGYVQPMLAEALLDGGDLDYKDWLKEVRKRMETYLARGYIYEKKHDGHRKIVYVDQHGVRAWSRPKSGTGKVGLPSQLPSHIVQELRRLVTAAKPEQSAYGTYDAELVGDDSTDSSSDVVRLDKANKLKLVVFDVMHLNNMTGKQSGNCCHQPYTVRRALLEQLFTVSGKGLKSVLLSEATKNATFDDVLAEWAKGGEGAMLKDPDSTYQPGKRNTSWVKVKKLEPVVYIITGYEAGKNGPYSKVKIRERDNADIETTVKTKNNAWLTRFAEDPDRYIGEELVCVIRGRTANGKPKHCMFDHFKNFGDE